jgi:bifunctional NMN adenylyltransferase/nudix hydrolase
MSKKQYDVAVVIGRFNLPHEGHFYLFREALKIAENLIIVIGSASSPRTPKNPFTEQDRERMIWKGLSKEEIQRISFAPVEDEIYANVIWCAKVQFAVEDIVVNHVQKPAASTCLVGYPKDESSFYLKMFPQWDLVMAEPYVITDGEVLSSTQLRESLFTLPFDQFDKEAATLVPKGVREYLSSNVISTDWFAQLKREKDFLDNYRKQFENYPYPPTFVTADAVVMQSGHVLMVTRKSEPGRGLLALPGGFVNQNERLQEAALRELVEETRIKVPYKILEKSIKGMKEFDHPNRSQRGRTITFAYHFQLEDVGSLPKVKGEDDAAEAKWYPISQILRSREHIFEDHLDIIRSFLGYL